MLLQCYKALGAYWEVLGSTEVHVPTYWEALDSSGRHQEGIDGHWGALGARCQVLDGTGKGIEGLQAAPGDTGSVLGGSPASTGGHCDVPEGLLAVLG